MNLRHTSPEAHRFTAPAAELGTVMPLIHDRHDSPTGRPLYLWVCPLPWPVNHMHSETTAGRWVIPGRAGAHGARAALGCQMCGPVLMCDGCVACTPRVPELCGCVTDTPRADLWALSPNDAAAMRGGELLYREITLK